MKRTTGSIKPLTTLLAAMLLAYLGSLPATKEPPTFCGFTQALRTMKTDETVKKCATLIYSERPALVPAIRPLASRSASASSIRRLIKRRRIFWLAPKR